MSRGNSIVVAACSGGCVLLWLVIGLSVYFAGYQRFVLINQSLKPCQSLVTATRNVYKLCEIEQCYGYGQSRQCYTETVACWDHYATFQYTPSGEYVLINSTQQYEEFLWNDYYPTQDEYVVGMIINAYYNMCPYNPLRHSDQVVCQEHGDMTPFYLALKDVPAAWGASISSLVFVCLSGFVLLLVICYWLFIWCNGLRFTCPRVTCPTITCPKFVLPQAFVRREVVNQAVPVFVYVDSPATASTIAPATQVNPKLTADFDSRPDRKSMPGFDSYQNSSLDYYAGGQPSSPPSYYDSVRNNARNGSDIV